MTTKRALSLSGVPVPEEPVESTFKMSSGYTEGVLNVRNAWLKALRDEARMLRQENAQLEAELYASAVPKPAQAHGTLMLGGGSFASQLTADGRELYEHTRAEFALAHAECPMNPEECEHFLPRDAREDYCSWCGGAKGEHRDFN